MEDLVARVVAMVLRKLGMVPVSPKGARVVGRTPRLLGSGNHHTDIQVGCVTLMASGGKKLESG